MLKGLIVSNYVAKPGFKYPGFDCAVEHRNNAHERLFGMRRWIDEAVSWEVLRVEETDQDYILSKLKKNDFDFMILSGSPYDCGDNERWVKALKMALQNYIKLENHKPVFGICFGLQILNELHGGDIGILENFKEGETYFILKANDQKIPTYSFHGQYLAELPKKASVLGMSSDDLPYLVQYSEKVIGIQSHPEIYLENENDNQISNNFWKSVFKNLLD